MKTRVLYDLGLVSGLHANRKSLTGIYRVSHQMAVHLLKQEGLEMGFCSTHLFDDVGKFLSKDPGLRMGRAFYADSQRRISILNSLMDACIPVDRPQGRRVREMLRHLLITGRVEANRRFFRVISPDSLETHDIFHSPFFSIPDKVFKNRKIKKFITVYDLIPLKFPQWFAGSEVAMIQQVVENMKAGAHAVCISQSTKNDLCEFSGCDPSQAHVIPLAAQEAFRPCTDGARLAEVRRKYGLSDRPYLLSLCTLEPRKNVDGVIRAFSRLVREQKLEDLDLVLVGNRGWKFEAIMEELDRQSLLRDRIHVTGFVADEDLGAIYSGAQAFIYLSLYEGFGLPPLEAMQCGVPVITSNTSSLPEVVGHAGVLVEPRDEDGICRALGKIHADAEFRKKLSHQSLERAKTFSWDRCAAETVRAYHAATV